MPAAIVSVTVSVGSAPVSSTGVSVSVAVVAPDANVSCRRFADSVTLREGAWGAARCNALGDLVTSAVGEAIPGFSAAARSRLVLPPDELEARFGVTDGAFTHGEITLDQILFMRPVAGWGRHATPIAGLYLGGAGTHPGPGIAGGPGLLAARQVIAAGKKARRK